MAWPANFEDPTLEGLVLVPDTDALVQDLGPFLSGRMMETDLRPASALICASENGQPVISEDGRIHFAFEGNANQAVNLERFHEKCRCAAARLATRSPSIAYGSALPEHLKPVARFDLLRFVFTKVLDQEAMETWSGEKVVDYLPPSDLETPTTDASVLEQLSSLPMISLAQGEAGIYAWSLMDGTIVTMQKSDRELTAWRPGDEGLRDILERAGLEFSDRVKFSL